MFRSRKFRGRSKQKRHLTSPAQGGSLSRGAGWRTLRYEPLEDRRVLAAGIVSLDVTAGQLTIYGDTSNNEVEIRQTLNVNEFQVTGKNGTLLTLDNGATTGTTYTVNGVANDIVVDLGDVAGAHAQSGGVDIFRFLGKVGGGRSVVGDDLHIHNTSGSNTNEIVDVLINDDLLLERRHFNGYNELAIQNSEITGQTNVNNDGTGDNLSGDSKTTIDNSLLRDSSGSWALWIENRDGMDVLTVSGNSQFGDGDAPPPDDPMVWIQNNDGPTMTTFTGASREFGPGTTTIYGDLEIYNDDNPQGTLDIVSFNSVNIFGDVTIENGAGNTETVVSGSELFSDLLGTPEHASGAGVVVLNDAGYDSFEASNDTSMPWGLYIDNDDAANGSSNWGSQTEISDSTINTNRGTAGPSGLTVFGDDGADVVNVGGSTIAGQLNLVLRDGNNQTMLFNQTVVDRFRYRGGNGAETITIDDAQIRAQVDVDLRNGTDRVEILNVDPATDLPPAVGMIVIDGGNNAGDTLATDFGPLLGTITGFNFFVML